MVEAQRARPSLLVEVEQVALVAGEVHILHMPQVDRMERRRVAEVDSRQEHTHSWPVRMGLTLIVLERMAQLEHMAMEHCELD